jgi:hypothetical protein
MLVLDMRHKVSMLYGTSWRTDDPPVPISLEKDSLIGFPWRHRQNKPVSRYQVKVFRVFSIGFRKRFLWASSFVRLLPRLHESHEVKRLATRP